MMWTGEKEAWEILLTLESKEVQRRAMTLFTPHNSTYKLTCFDQDIQISLSEQDIISSSHLGSFLLKELGEYSRLSILRYLVHAKALPLSGNLVKPSDLPGGDFFSKGTHVLPLDKITARFEYDFDGFINAGKALGGSQIEYGDTSIRLFPFPRVPVTIILWAGDDEFPAKASLLFDSSCTTHMATDILWSTAMMTIEMLRFSSTLLR
jgi:hypothetical protein